MQVLIRYKLKEGQVAANMASLTSVYDELTANDPGGLRWATFQLDNEVSFVSLVEFEGEPGAAAHHRLESFQRHRAALEGWCEEPPVVQVLHQVGAYGFPEPMGQQSEPGGGER